MIEMDEEIVKNTVEVLFLKEEREYRGDRCLWCSTTCPPL